MKKLNFGCGNRIAPGWDNIDFSPAVSGVRQANLLAGFPYANQTFDVVYSSHVLEHFAKDQGQRILRECYRVLKPGGICRIVVPNLESSCREYLAILDAIDSSPDAPQKYEWVILELLDQMVRQKACGEMMPFIQRIQQSGSDELKCYIKERTQNDVCSFRSFFKHNKRTARDYWDRIKEKLQKGYIRGLLSLIPPSLRDHLIDQTQPGEKHRWMYDKYSLKNAMQTAGFSNVQFLDAFTSDIANFKQDGLDTVSPTLSYKNNSIYCEARKV